MVRLRRWTDQVESAVGLALELLVASLETLFGVLEVAFNKGLILVEAERHDLGPRGEKRREGAMVGRVFGALMADGVGGVKKHRYVGKLLEARLG
jgi:hypothetical protein